VEAEAKRKVEEEARRNAEEAEAKRQAEEAARRRSEVEAESKRQAEEEEAKRKVEEEEQRRAEEVARHPPSRAKAIKDFAVFRDIDAPWCPEMVALPADEFMMGSPAGERERDKSESPRHKITIGYRFAIGRYPVTFAEYDHFCVTAQRGTPNDLGWGRGRRPLINVFWPDARAYCAWLASESGQPFRLPSEAEWEYACRAGTTTRYAFGDAIMPKDANYSLNVSKTTEVGAYPPNAWGLYDMHGNVWEWVEDIYHNSYEDAPNDGSAWTDGEGENSSRNRVIRGGSWINLPRYLRSANRIRTYPVIRNFNLGFRVARTLD
jgi:formylglycine-generating enzyme required for sulfatase activity